MTAFLEAYLTNCSLTIRMSSCPLPRMQALLEVSSTLLSLHRVHPKHPRSCCSNMWSSLNSELEPTTEQLRVVHKPPNDPGTKASFKPKNLLHPMLLLMQTVVTATPHSLHRTWSCLKRRHSTMSVVLALAVLPPCSLLELATFRHLL